MSNPSSHFFLCVHHNMVTCLAMCLFNTTNWYNIEIICWCWCLENHQDVGHGHHSFHSCSPYCFPDIFVCQKLSPQKNGCWVEPQTYLCEKKKQEWLLKKIFTFEKKIHDTNLRLGESEGNCGNKEKTGHKYNFMALRGWAALSRSGNSFGRACTMWKKGLSPPWHPQAYKSVILSSFMSKLFCYKTRIISNFK